MDSHPHLDDDDDFGGDFTGVHPNRRSGVKRSFGDLDDDEDDIFGSNKVNSKLDETAPGVATGIILSLRESLQKCKEDLTKYEIELEAARSDIQKWNATFQNEPFIPSGTNPEPKLIVTYIQALRSSEKSLKEQLEKAKKKEAAFIVTFAKREQEVAELKAAIWELRSQLKPLSTQTRRLLLDPVIHEEFTRLKNLVEEKEKKVKELQDNVNAVNFSANSRMGKMLMAKCKTLQEENEEIGNQASDGKIQELSNKLALQKSRNAEIRQQFDGLCKNIEVLTNDVERSNEMVFILQEKLEERNAEINRLNLELQHKNSCKEEITDPTPAPALDSAPVVEGPLSDVGDITPAVRACIEGIS